MKEASGESTRVHTSYTAHYTTYTHASITRVRVRSLPLARPQDCCQTPTPHASCGPSGCLQRRFFPVARTSKFSRYLMFFSLI